MFIILHFCSLEKLFSKIFSPFSAFGSAPRRFPHLVRVVPAVNKQRLLRHSRVRAERFRLHAREERSHGPVHPHVHGEGVKPVQAVKQGAFRHLRSHAADLAQRFPRLRKRKPADLLERKAACTRRAASST